MIEEHQSQQSNKTLHMKEEGNSKAKGRRKALKEFKFKLDLS